MGISVVTIYVRHGFKNGKPCKYTGEEFCRRCDCPKHLRWTQNGVQYRRKAGTRSWEKAEEVKRQIQDQLEGRTSETNPEDNARAISKAIDLFITDKKVQGVTNEVVSRYVCELGRLRDYCEHESVFVVRGITRELLTGYAETWVKHYAATSTRASVRERLRSFLRYCFECRWLDRIPAVPKVQVDETPTLPLTAEQYAHLLKTIEDTKPLRWDDKGGNRQLQPATKSRLRALIQLMRWSGLAIQDALTLERSAIKHDEARGIFRVVTSRQKTGTDVSVPLPPEIAEEILAVQNRNPRFVFWTGEGRGTTIARMWGRRFIRPLFEAAGLANDGHMLSHRLRDTFAVDLLEKGVPLEEVSKLLGHTSIKTTERHYAKWVKGRQDRLDSLVMGTWKDATGKRKKRTARAA